MFFSCRTAGDKTKKLHVFRKGMLDTLDDVFWMLPFSSKNLPRIRRKSFGRKTILPMIPGKIVATRSWLSTGFLLQRNSLNSSVKHG